MKGSAQNVALKLISVIGDAQNHTVTINFLAESPVYIKHFQIDNPSAVDLEGNIIEAKNYGCGPNFIMAELFDNVPVKGRVILKNIDKQIPLLKIVKISHYALGTDRNNRSVLFKDVPVTWQ